MKDKQSSLTASGIAVARAVESEKAQGVRICYDPYAAKFLNPWFYNIMRVFIDTGNAEWAGAGVQGFLAGRGFVNITDVASEDLHQRYFSGLNARRKVAWGYGIASGEVA